ncbi:MAG: hypothetical protein ACI8S6_000152 [Myxococcota bacterium]|jgi:hypothetical protein
MSMSRIYAVLALFSLVGCGDKLVDGDGDGALDSLDCDDADATVFPGADELCDGIDSDCDGVVDNDPVDGSEHFLDYDGDGYGGASVSILSCEDAPSGYVDNSEDCDDLSAAAFPGGDEVCDGLDNDCDGNVDIGATDITLFYADGDGDGYGNPAQSTQGCFPPDGYVDNGADCDDTDPERSPETQWYPDLDGDGYGSTDFVVIDCEEPDGYTLNGEDCDDERSDVFPGAEEVCDGADTNCDGTVPADDVDDDGDGQAPCGGDCDDSSSDIYLGGVEVCANEVDEDCDGRLDNSCPVSTSSADISITGTSSDNFGISVATTDVDSDGAADLPVTANGAADADVSIVGEATLDYLGYTLAAADLDGDGYGDVAMGAYGAQLGEVYVFYGPLSGALTVADADATLSGTGTSSGLSQYLLSATADADGDGDIDLMVGAHTYNSSKGAIALFDEPSGELTVEEGIALYSGTATTGYAGYGGAVVGDVDGDGVPDAVFGEPNSDSAYLLYGPLTGSLDSSMADVTFDNSTRSGDYPGSRVAGGDLNNDGSIDVVISAKYDDIGGTSTGTIAVFYGPLSGTIDLYDADAIITGGATYTYLGQQTDALSAVDLDGDGTSDLIFGASSDDSLYTNAGGVFVHYGPLSGAVTSTSYDRGFFGTSTYQYTGRSSAAVADLDGDKVLDLAFGAYGASSFSGAAYVFSGAGF